MEIALQSENVKQASEIFEENSDMIRIAIYSQAHDKSIVDDIFQDLFISLAGSPIPLNIENTKGYLRRAIRNDVIDLSIKNKRRQSREAKCARMYRGNARYDNPENTVAMCDTIEYLFETIKKELTAHEARALIEKYHNDRENDEAARIMGITKRSFSHYLCTGLKRVRQLIR